MSVAEMADVVGLSRSSFYSMINAGVFPRPIQNEFCKRPVFDLDLQQRCLEIRRTGIGFNGQPVLFNRKRGTQKTRQGRKPAAGEYGELVEAVRSLGVAANAEIVEEALRSLFPNGWSEIDQAELVRQVFLNVQRKK